MFFNNIKGRLGNRSLDVGNARAEREAEKMLRVARQAKEEHDRLKALEEKKALEAEEEDARRKYQLLWAQKQTEEKEATEAKLLALVEAQKKSQEEAARRAEELAMRKMKDAAEAERTAANHELEEMKIHMQRQERINVEKAQREMRDLMQAEIDDRERMWREREEHVQQQVEGLKTRLHVEEEDWKNKEEQWRAKIFKEEDARLHAEQAVRVAQMEEAARRAELEGEREKVQQEIAARERAEKRERTEQHSRLNSEKDAQARNEQLSQIDAELARVKVAYEAKSKHEEDVKARQEVLITRAEECQAKANECAYKMVELELNHLTTRTANIQTTSRLQQVQDSRKRLEENLVDCTRRRVEAERNAAESSVKLQTAHSTHQMRVYELEGMELDHQNLLAELKQTDEMRSKAEENMTNAASGQQQLLNDRMFRESTGGALSRVARESSGGPAKSAQNGPRSPKSRGSSARTPFNPSLSGAPSRRHLLVASAKSDPGSFNRKKSEPFLSQDSASSMAIKDTSRFANLGRSINNQAGMIHRMQTKYDLRSKELDSKTIALENLRNATADAKATLERAQATHAHNVDVQRDVMQEEQLLRQQIQENAKQELDLSAQNRPAESAANIAKEELDSLRRQLTNWERQGDVALGEQAAILGLNLISIGTTPLRFHCERDYSHIRASHPHYEALMRVMSEDSSKQPATRPPTRSSQPGADTSRQPYMQYDRQATIGQTIPSLTQPLVSASSGGYQNPQVPQPPPASHLVSHPLTSPTGPPNNAHHAAILGNMGNSLSTDSRQPVRSQHESSHSSSINDTMDDPLPLPTAFTFDPNYLTHNLPNGHRAPQYPESPNSRPMLNRKSPVEFTNTGHRYSEVNNSSSQFPALPGLDIPGRGSTEYST